MYPGAALTDPRLTRAFQRDYPMKRSVNQNVEEPRTPPSVHLMPTRARLIFAGSLAAGLLVLFVLLTLYAKPEKPRTAPIPGQRERPQPRMVAVPFKLDLATKASEQLGFLKRFVVNRFRTPYFLVFVGFVLLLEWVKPAQARGGVLSKGFIYDASIGLVIISFQFVIVDLTTGVLFSLYARLHLPQPVMTATLWSNGVRAAFGLAIGDFMSWASHWVRHKIPRLWRFHAMHHSQTELNIFTEFRNHPLDSLIASVLQSLPLFVLQISFETSVAFLVCYKYYLMFTHANVDLDYDDHGWAGYLLVSPRFHRVHHAIAPGLHDHNFGAVLSIWDVVFGTSKTGLAHAPETGVEGFPTEHHVPLRQGWLTYLRQLAAPFGRLPSPPLATNPPRRKEPAPIEPQPTQFEHS